VSEDLQASLRFQLEEAVRARTQAEEDYAQAHAKWELERTTLRAQLASVQASALEAMERSNNPTRLTMAVREQVDIRLKAARQEWEIEVDGERRRMTAELERLRKATSADEKKEAARRAVLQKLGKLPAGDGPAQKTAEQWAREFEDARIAWETEKQHLRLRVEQLEKETTRGRDEIRNEAFRELSLQYEPKLAASEDARQRLQSELTSVSSELEEEHRRLTARIEHLEEAVAQAAEAARLQATAEVTQEWEARIEELERQHARSERRMRDSEEEMESEVRRSRKNVARLEAQLKEARETAYRAQRGVLGGGYPPEDDTSDYSETSSDGEIEGRG
jgi:hypothetical protein